MEKHLVLLLHRNQNILVEFYSANYILTLLCWKSTFYLLRSPTSTKICLLTKILYIDNIIHLFFAFFYVKIHYPVDIFTSVLVIIRLSSKVANTTNSRSKCGQMNPIFYWKATNCFIRKSELKCCRPSIMLSITLLRSPTLLNIQIGSRKTEDYH